MANEGSIQEELVFGDPTTGAANDLEKATEIARQMVERYGMSERIGFVGLSRGDPVVLGHGFGYPATHADAPSTALDPARRDLIPHAQPPRPPTTPGQPVDKYTPNKKRHASLERAHAPVVIYQILLAASDAL